MVFPAYDLIPLKIDYPVIARAPAPLETIEIDPALIA
jgi:hypothetical protein